MSTSSPYVSIPEAARSCGVTRATMWNWVKSGRIDAFVTPGGHHRILRGDVEALVAESRSISAPASRGPAILIVDDDPHVLKVLQRDLARRGYRAAIAANGFSAGVRISRDRPELVVLDLFMEGLDGFDVCRQIKQSPELRHIKVLAMTGHDTPETRRRIAREGADGYISKTAGLKPVSDRIARLLGGSAASNPQASPVDGDPATLPQGGER